MTVAPGVRPMTQADYDTGNAVTALEAHPTRDLIVGAVVGAAALWAVPRLLDYVTDQLSGHSDQLEFEDET